MSLNRDEHISNLMMELAGKVKEHMEERTGHEYKVWPPSEISFWWLSMISCPDELRPLKLVELFRDHTLEIGFEQFQTFGKLDESDYYVFMDIEEVMGTKDPKVRRAARKLAAGPIKDCEVAERAARKASLKHFGREDAIEIDYFWMAWKMRFNVEGMSDDEIIARIDRCADCMMEAWREYLEWYNSEERKRLYERTRLKREVRCRHFYVKWPPDTGDPKKDEEIVGYVRDCLSDGTKMYTPEGQLELRDGAIVLKESKGKR